MIRNDAVLVNCSVCKKQMTPVTCSTYVPASEWYCPACHKSKPMEEETANYLISMEPRRK